jgi:6-phosphogluconolactonase
MNHSAPPEIIICKDAGELAAGAAERILRAAGEAIVARGRFTLALSGGSTPEKTYALLAQPERAARLDWTKTYLFFGDERFVLPDDTRSNLQMAKRSLLDRVSIPPGHLFAVPTGAKSPAEGAAAYAQTLATFFAQPLDGPPPRLDLILLGLGDDGHTASLFPGAAALTEDRAWVTWSPPGVLPPPVDRITLTFPALNAARQVLFLVAGVNKAEPLRDVLEGNALRERRPAAGIRPADGTLTWLVDEAAAGLLARKP